MPILYGAFAFASLGEWPKYTKEEMYAALARHALGPSRAFVVKPASDGTNYGLPTLTLTLTLALVLPLTLALTLGTNYGLLVMKPERWRRENWTYAPAEI